MDDLFAINSAKTEFRDAYNTGNPEPLIAVLDPEAVYFADAQRMAIGAGCADAIRANFDELFGRFHVHLDPIVIEIRIEGDVACEYGWHEWTLTPKDGGATFTRKDRYVDVWRRNAGGEWKLWTYIDNSDVPMTMPAIAA
jgi:ketosteroid isomerase-like protein